MKWDKILNKIYTEKDIFTNISLFAAAGGSFFVYIYKGDFILTTIGFIAVFSLAKILSSLTVKYISIQSFKTKFSDEELSVIDFFVSNGTSFVDLKRGMDREGLDSLISRGYIKFINEGGPSGFELDEDLYVRFLSLKKQR